MNVILGSFDELAVAVIATDLAGVVTGWNKGAETLYGYTTEEAIGQPIENLTVGPLEQDQAAQIMEQLAQGRPWFGRFTCKRRNGGFLSVGVADMCIVDETGAVCGVVGLSREDAGDLAAVLSELRELRQAVKEHQEVQSEVARDVAGRLHDDLSQQCHQLLAETHQLLESAELSDSDRERLDTLRVEQEHLVSSLQNLWRSLRPPLLDEFGVRASLEHLVTEAKIAGKFDVSVAIDEGIEDLSASSKELIVLVVQEALANVVAHARAQRCSLTVTLERDSVIIEVVDDGVGMQGPEGFGLRLMRQRVRTFGGYLAIQPGPAGGTCLMVELEKEWSPMAPLESLIDPHVIYRGVRDASGNVTDFVITDANDAAVAAAGRPRSEVIGAHLLDLWPDDREAGLLARYVHTLETGEPLVIDDFAFPEDSLELGRRYDFRAVKVGDSLSFTWRDVTQRHRMTEEFRLLAENASDVVYRHGPDNIVEWISPSIIQALGWTPGDLVGKPLTDIVHPDDAPGISERTAIVEREGRGTFEVRLRAATDVYHWVRLTVHNLTGESGKTIGRVGSFQLIDEEHQRREELAQSQALFRRVAEHASDVVLLVDGNDVISWASPSVAQVLGWEPSDLVGRFNLDIVAAEDVAVVTSGRNQATSGDLAKVTIRVRRASGDLLWVEASSRLTMDDPSQPLTRVVSLRNVDVEHVQREKLEVSEARYQLLAENASDVVILVGLDDVVRWVSPSIVDVLGWQPEDVVGRRTAELVPADDLSRIVEGRSRSRGGVNSQQHRMYMADGSLLWVSSLSKLVPGRGGEPDVRVVSLRDVHVEVEAREAQAESEARLRLLAENSSDIVYQLNPAGEITWISPAVKRILGWDPESLIGTPSHSLIFEGDVALAAGGRAELLSKGSNAQLSLRYKAADGHLHWMSLHAHGVRGRAGQISSIVVGLRVTDDEVKARQELEESREAFRILAENASDVVLRATIEGQVLWVSPSIQGELGWTADEVLGRQFLHFVHAEDRAKVVARQPLLQLGEAVPNVELRVLAADGEVRWVEASGRVLRDSGGRVNGTAIALRDCHDEVLARRARLTLSEGSRVLMRSESEEGLLREMCETAVLHGGFVGAWFGRPTQDAGELEKVAISRKNRDYLEPVEVKLGDGTPAGGPIASAFRTGRTVVLSDFLGHSELGPWYEQAVERGLRSLISLPVRIAGVVLGVWVLYASEPNAFDAVSVATLEDLASEIGYGLGRLRDQQRLRRSLEDQLMLKTAIEQAGESIIVTDSEGLITYINPPVSQTSGYSWEELRGQNPRIFQSGLQDRGFYEELWSAILGGRSWRGVLINRRKDGVLYEEESTISPIHSADGALVAFVAVKHDLTSERRLQENLSREQQDRNAVLNVMRNVRRGESLEETSKTICEAMVELESVDAACLLLLHEGGALLPVAISGSAVFDVDGVSVYQPDDPGRIASVADGPVLVPMEPAAWKTNPEVIARALDEGLRVIVLAPVRWEGKMTAVLALGIRDPLLAASAESRFAHFEAVGSYAGSLLGGQALRYEQRESYRAKARDVIDHQQFRPVFQPFVNLATGEVVGYEALTRFDDGTRPDQRFEEAHQGGLGCDLEVACAAAALEAARNLPPGRFLSINFSPDTLLNGSAARCVEGSEREIVIEITEHAEIHNYPELKRALGAIAACKFAVDDAGVGYTSLKHIIELAPNYVKLDISLVRDMDHDPVRQAMVAGMCHFASQSGTVIIAEGVETESELEALKSLGVTLAEGSLLG